ncbi:unnamed protein product [Caenorhabditis sp. 36 PRJEB53466]|nr:unnamed protein product [Caenorhabditis sp. 36 PRJEB53466]
MYMKRPSLRVNSMVPFNSSGENYLICILQPDRTSLSKSVYSNVTIKTGERDVTYILDAKGALRVLMNDVPKWLEESTLCPYYISFKQLSDSEWWKLLKKLRLVCIRENNVWRLEPERHVLRLGKFSSSFLANELEKLVELHPPWHPIFPLAEISLASTNIS